MRVSCLRSGRACAEPLLRRSAADSWLLRLRLRLHVALLRGDCVHER